jgi:Rrf2 family protein
MAHFGTAVEYGLHCLLWLARSNTLLASSRDLAELQGVPVPFMAKIFPLLEKAGIVIAQQGIEGGYRLARPAGDITVLEVVDAIEGPKPLFNCSEIRGRCALFGGSPPSWSGRGVCGIHATMMRAESKMREELARTTIQQLAMGAASKAPKAFDGEVQQWFATRVELRRQARAKGIRRGRKTSG